MFQLLHSTLLESDRAARGRSLFEKKSYRLEEQSLGFSERDWRWNQVNLPGRLFGLNFRVQVVFIGHLHDLTYASSAIACGIGFVLRHRPVVETPGWPNMQSSRMIAAEHQRILHDLVEYCLREGASARSLFRWDSWEPAQSLGQRENRAGVGSMQSLAIVQFVPYVGGLVLGCDEGDFLAKSW